MSGSEIAERRISVATGLNMFVREAGRDDANPDRPLVLLLHGFPELSYSWRHILPRLAAAGYWAVAPDQRGYGHTTGATLGYDVDLQEFTLASVAADAVALIAALGRRRVTAVIGHDFGSPVAATCALRRPDVFEALVMMSAPSAPASAFPLGAIERPDATALTQRTIHDDLLDLARPRKHYQWYYSERRAAPDMDAPPQGLAAFLRAYYHMKSADWADNAPFALDGWHASELEKMPTYYIMDAAHTMPEAVATHMPSRSEVASNAWLTDDDLAVYVDAFSRTGFQSSLNWYRGRTSGASAAADALYSGAKFKVPATFIAGKEDWGIEQVPGARAAMEAASLDWRGTTLIDRAGHWVQQERPRETGDAILKFLADL